MADPKKPKLEYPPLGVPYIESFDQNVEANPIVRVNEIPYPGTYELPALFAQLPDPADRAEFPSNVFVKATPYDRDQRTSHTYKILPAPWVFDEAVDKQSQALVTIQRRENKITSITPGITVSSGSMIETRQQAIDANLALEIIATTPLPSPWMYDVAVDPDTLSVITTKKRLNYAANITPGVVVTNSPLTITETRRQDLDTDTLTNSNWASWEIVTATQTGALWSETECIGKTYEEIFVDAIYLNPLGWDMDFIPVRPRTVEAIALYYFTNAQQFSLPSLAGNLLPNGATVYNPSQLWNPQLVSVRSFFGFSLSNVFIDPTTFSGVYITPHLDISFNIDIAGSVPTATDYASYVASGYYVPYRFQSKRFKGGAYANKALYIPLL